MPLQTGSSNSLVQSISGALLDVYSLMETDSVTTLLNIIIFVITLHLSVYVYYCRVRRNALYIFIYISYNYYMLNSII